MSLTQFEIRGYTIVDGLNNRIDACGQFMYKGYQISMSTIGLSKGACQSHVCIFTGNNYQELLKGDCHTVEEAIEFINKL